jgi:hypothetical protein
MSEVAETVTKLPPIDSFFTVATRIAQMSDLRFNQIDATASQFAALKAVTVGNLQPDGSLLVNWFGNIVRILQSHDDTVRAHFVTEL